MMDPKAGSSASKRGDEAINLASIQRADPCAVHIIAHATQTALYKFDANTHQWDKTDVEGSMFIYQRADKPMYSMLIANRNSPIDFIEPLTSEIRLKKQLPSYLFFCKPDGTINGLWFYYEADCERMFVTMERLVNDQCSNARPMSESQQTAQTPRVTDSRSPNLNGRQQALIRPTAVRAEEKLLPPMLQVLLSDRPAAEQLASNRTPVKIDSSNHIRDSNSVSVLKMKHDPSSVASLAGLSTLSLQGSEPEALNDADVERERLLTPSIIATTKSTNAPVPLTGQQLGQALEHMLRTDPDFIKRIHLAYVDSLNAAYRLN